MRGMVGERQVVVGVCKRDRDENRETREAGAVTAAGEPPPPPPPPGPVSALSPFCLPCPSCPILVLSKMPVCLFSENPNQPTNNHQPQLDLPRMPTDERNGTVGGREVCTCMGQERMHGRWGRQRGVKGTGELGERGWCGVWGKGGMCVCAG